MAIPPQFKDELRARVKLSDFIGRKISVSKAGREFKACCPFHNEKTPSFTINDQKGFYHCFGCGAHGDVITFAMQYSNLPFMEALEVLASEAGMQVPKPSPKEQEAYQLRDRLIMACEAASKWFIDQLYIPQNKDILAYLTKRGLSEQTLSNFSVGYAPDDMNQLRVTLQQQGFSAHELLKAGLLKQGKAGKEPYAFFRDRVMFPVRDRRGRVVAFGGRVIPDNIRVKPPSDFTPPKYINTGETPIFHKGQLVYGMSLAAQAAGRGHQIIIVEGYMDAIALHQAGFKGAVAPLGTAMTEEQIALCWQMSADELKVPVLCFDGDSAGQRAAYRAMQRVLPMLKPNHSLRFLFLPSGEDPDSFIRTNGKKAFEGLLQNTKELIDVVWDHLIEGRAFLTPESKAGLNSEVEALVSQIVDKDVQYHYKSELRNRIFTQFRKKSFTYKKGNARFSQISLLHPQVLTDQMRVNILIACCIQHPSLIEEYEETLGFLEITDEELDKTRQIIISAISEESNDLHAAFESVGLGGFVQDLLAAFYNDPRYTWMRAENDTAFAKERLDEVMRLSEAPKRNNLLQAYARQFKETQ